MSVKRVLEYGPIQGQFFPRLERRNIQAMEEYGIPIEDPLLGVSEFVPRSWEEVLNECQKHNGS